MIILKLQGGLGNQMFQYATAKALSLHSKQPLFLDSSFFDQTRNLPIDGFTYREYELNIFPNIHESFVSKEVLKKFQSEWSKLRRILGLKTYKIIAETCMHFTPVLSKQKGNLYLDGYWQSEKYFNAFRDEIIKCFAFDLKLIDEENKKLAREMMSCESVSVHIRRNDYLKPAINKVHGTCTLQYYSQAIDLLRSRLPKSVLYFFSDDETWVKENFSGLHNIHCVEGNRGKNSWKDMYLMSQCKHHIIANSSFSWWGAWLSENTSKIVVAPEQWFKDKDMNKAAKSIIPEKWSIL